MNAFVILAAGRGTRIGRVGETLHKALVPLAQRAVLTHLLDLAPNDAEVIICLGHRGEQIREFVRLAHPKRRVTFVDVDGWDGPEGGPGLSLLAAREVVGDRSMVFTSCDTLWHDGDLDWESSRSYACVAAVPAGTQPARWCRVVLNGTDRVLSILDKVPDSPIGLAYTGVSRIIREDLEAFWSGVIAADRVAGERQVTGGLQALVDNGRLDARRITWVDVGDEQAYARAIALFSGYDWTKFDEATYVLPAEDRVVKFWDSVTTGNRSAERAYLLAGTVPELLDRGRNMLAYRFVPGESVYERLARDHVSADEYVGRLMAWIDDSYGRAANVDPDADVYGAADRFYRVKTMHRMQQLRAELAGTAADAASRVPWDDIAHACYPSVWHGDLNYGNIIDTGEGWQGIDWRGDFAGHSWGDRNYDYAKLLAGTVVHWDNARRGDFRPWDEGQRHRDAIISVLRDRVDTDLLQITAAVTLLNSAPLHAAPLDEVLVMRASAWLEEVL